LLIGADYTILLYAEPGELAPDLILQRIGAFLACQEFWRERERKGEKYIYNLRPLVFELTYQGYAAAAEEHRIFLRVQQRPGATGRPDEVVAALGFDEYARTLRRERLYFSDQADDVALFERYPLITQAAISPPSSKTMAAKNQGKSAGAKTPHKTGRSISERAGDEFV
jgi:hypothetical protein